MQRLRNVLCHTLLLAGSSGHRCIVWRPQRRRACQNQVVGVTPTIAVKASSDVMACPQDIREDGGTAMQTNFVIRIAGFSMTTATVRWTRGQGGD